MYRICYIHRCNVGVGEGGKPRVQMLTTQSFFYVVVSFSYWFQEGQIVFGVTFVETCVYVCVYIKDWFKQIFPPPSFLLDSFVN